MNLGDHLLIGVHNKGRKGKGILKAAIGFDNDGRVITLHSRLTCNPPTTHVSTLCKEEKARDKKGEGVRRGHTRSIGC